MTAPRLAAIRWDAPPPPTPVVWDALDAGPLDGLDLHAVSQWDAEACFPEFTKMLTRERARLAATHKGA